MMRIGLCANMSAKDPWGVGYECIPELSRMGFDFVELPLTPMANMPDAAFEDEVLGRLAGAGIPCGACNIFFPGDVRLTGPDADLGRIGDYVKRALPRAARAGAEVVVLGSSGARNLSHGTTPAQGYVQLAEALGVIAGIAARHSIRIAIEPLNRLESNIVNSYLSALYLAALSRAPNVGALVDAYHFALGNEPLSDLCTCLPIHVHYAEPLGRKLPDCPSDWGRAFFGQLRAIGYEGMVSLEGVAGEPFGQSASQALNAMQALCQI